VVGIILNNKTLDMDLGGFKVFRKTEFVLDISVRNTIVSHHGNGAGKNLSLERWICHALRISDHTR